MKAPDERLSNADIELRILHSAASCGSAARYIWPERVEALIKRGLLVVRSEHSAELTATATGRAFMSGVAS
jgi:hypothetical protein